MKKQCVLLALFCLAMGVPAGFMGETSVGFQAVAQAQTNKVSGVVVDQSGDPLIGATVLVKGTKTGAVTDAEGRYSINASKDATLVVSYVGYKTATVKASVSKVVLESTANALDEVVITGEFGTKRLARAVGSSAQNVKATEITESGRADFVTALQGKVSGMNIASTSGAPGASTKITLRSMTSLSGSNEPLFIVDGMPINSSTFNSQTGMIDNGEANNDPRYQDASSRGNDINPEDIESMTILKGAAAAALYGSDASNGAIVITTKKGRSGKARVNYSNQFSWSKAYGWPEFQDKYANGAYGTTNWYYQNYWGGSYPTGATYYDNAKGVAQTGFTMRHNVSVEGGNDKMTVRGSGSFLTQDGVLKNTGLDRQNLTLSGRVEAFKWISFEGSMQFAHQTNKKSLRGGSGPIPQSYKWPKVDDMTNYMAEDGIHMRYPKYYVDGDLINPLFGIYKNKYEDETNRFITTMSVKIVPVEKTFVRAQFGWDASASQYVVANHPYYSTYNFDVVNGGTFNMSKYNTYDPSMNILAGYNDTYFDKLSLGVQFGYHQNQHRVNNLATYGNKFQLVDFYSINNCTPSTVVSRKSETTKRLQAISGQVELGYNNFAFVAFRFRNDWSSTLPKANNSYFYPAIEGSFIPTDFAVISENLPWLSYLKVRAAWAKVGKDAPVNSIEPALVNSDFNGGGFRYDYTGPNRALKPEMTTSWEVGAEGRFWDDRINADFTYFKTHCADQIISGFRMSYATGFVLNTLNVGSFDTWGWEGHVDVDILRGRDFSWNVGVNMNHTGSKVTDLPEAVTEYYNAYTWIVDGIRGGVAVGRPITSLTGLRLKENAYGELILGVNSGNTIAGTDWVHFGDREPKLRFGLQTSVRFKDFRLNATFAGRFGATMVNGTTQQMMQRGLSWESVRLRESGYAIRKGVLQDGKQFGEKRNYNNIAMDMFSASGTYGYYGYWQDYCQENIHYMRCQELRLTYTVPTNWIKKQTRGLVSAASVYVSGQDLFTITNYSGFDVAGNGTSAALGGVGAEGIDFWSLPSPRTYTCGLSLTF